VDGEHPLYSVPYVLCPIPLTPPSLNYKVFLPQLLLYPNPSSPLNGEAANMLIHTERKYERKVQEMVQKVSIPRTHTRTHMHTYSPATSWP